MNLLLRILRVWIAWVTARPRLVLGVAFATALASAGYTVLKLDMRTAPLELISPNHPLTNQSDKLDPFISDGRKRFTVVIQSPSRENATAFVEALATKINEDPDHFESVAHRVDSDAFRHSLLLYMDKEDLLHMRDKLDSKAELIRSLTEQPELLTFLRLVNQEVASRMVGDLFTGFLEGEAPGKAAKGKEEPFDLGLLITTLEGMSDYLRGTFTYKSPWPPFFKRSGWNPDLEGYFWEADKSRILAFVVPRMNPDREFSSTRDALARLRGIIDGLEASHRGVHAGVTGQEALDSDELSTVLEDMALAAWLSLSGVLLLMIVFLRSFRRPLIVMVTLTVGLCWTFGWTTLVIGHLNILSVVFAPLLCGLGVHYGIHWFSRYEEEERCGAVDPRSIIARVNDRSGPGIFLAGLSAAVSFLPLVFTGFRGLVELGAITGMGIAFTLIAGFSVLPALSAYAAGRAGRRLSAVASPYERSLFQLSPRAARRILTTAGILCMLGIWSANRVHFDLDSLRLQAASAESVAWEKSLVENAKRPALFGASFAHSPEEAMTKIKSIEALPSVSEVESAFSLLPEDQEDKLPILRSMRERIPEIRPTVIENRPSDVEEFIEILERIRFKMQDEQAANWGAGKPLAEQAAQVRSLSQDIITLLHDSPESSDRLFQYRRQFRDDLLNKWDSLRKGTNPSIMTVEGLPEMLRDSYFQNGTYLLRIFPRESIWDEEALSRFVNQVRTIDPQVIGDPVSLHAAASDFRSACLKASIYALIAVFILLFLAFRRLSLTLLALIPVAAGTIWTLGVMGIADVRFNLANSMFMPLIIGAGVEYGIIILQRWREGTVEQGHLPLSAGKGVILAALTTTVGFATLMVSNHRGIFSLGFIAWSGSLCVLVAAILVLPAILARMDTPRVLHERRNW